ncbi:MAG: AraC family transcriptional regulator [Actinomycetota bacterium]
MTSSTDPTAEGLFRDALDVGCQPELLALFDLLVDVMFCAKSRDGRYVAVNAAFVRRTGRNSKREVIGRRPSEVFHPALAERYEEQDQRVLATGQPLRDELEVIRREDGSLGWYVTTKLPVADTGEGDAAADEGIGLVSISSDLRTPQSNDQVPESMARVVDHVQVHLAERIRVAELADVAGCSVSQLERRMRRTFGLTPAKYLLRARVDRAAELLVDGDLGLAEVAQVVGFYDQADFTHRFARLTNETPAQFRSRQRRLRPR